MAVGTARLGLKSALITRVGDEHMGRFIREQLGAEGVDTRGIATDPERLTALVILGIRDQKQFPLIFYRDNCADMALCEADIDPAFIAEARCLTVTGTHLSNIRTEAAVLKALKLARGNKARTALDIDYRPNLWGLSGHGDGENRFIESATVTAKLQSHLHLFDLIVGTEEEFHIAGGSTDTITALKAVRMLTGATLVCKRGPMGAAAFTGLIPPSLDEGKTGPGFPIEVFNVLGAGDGFMSGLLKGWLDDETWETALKYANACGAFAVSRHGCAPAYPSWAELQFFFKHGIANPALRYDAALEQIHWSTNRVAKWPVMRVFAFDHRLQFEDIAAQVGADKARIGAFKSLCFEAARKVADGKQGYGILCDARLGQDALYAAAGSGLWIGRPVELPGSRPVELEIGDDYGSALAEWPREHVVKLLVFCHPDDAPEMQAAQEATVMRCFKAARANGLEFLLEIIPSKVAAVDDASTAKLIERFYEIGVYPDWWKLEPMLSHQAWANTCAAVEQNDPYCRGIVVLGLDAPEAELIASFDAVAHYPLVKGFAIGRTIFGDIAKTWLNGALSNGTALTLMEQRFRTLANAWDAAKAKAEKRAAVQDKSS
jgi:5-dehydro-2-deoxygluconokinase